MEQGVSFARLDRDAPDRFVTLRKDLGVTTFGLNQMLLQPGQRSRVHRHARQEEVYLVLEGELTLILDEGEHTLEPGELARVAPSVRRQLLNRGPELLVLIALGGAEPHEGRDGEAFDGWDSTEPKQPRDVPLPDDLEV